VGPNVFDKYTCSLAVSLDAELQEPGQFTRSTREKGEDYVDNFLRILFLISDHVVITDTNLFDTARFLDLFQNADFRNFLSHTYNQDGVQPLILIAREHDLLRGFEEATLRLDQPNPNPWFWASWRRSDQNALQEKVPLLKKEGKYDLNGLNDFAKRHLHRDYIEFLGHARTVFRSPETCMREWAMPPEKYPKEVETALANATDLRLAKFGTFSQLRDTVLEIIRKNPAASRSDIYEAIGLSDPRREPTRSELTFKKYFVDFPAFCNANRASKCLLTTGIEYNKSVSKYLDLGIVKYSVSGNLATPYYPALQRIRVPKKTKGQLVTGTLLDLFDWKTIEALRETSQFGKNMSELRKLRNETNTSLSDLARKNAEHWDFLIDQGILEVVKERYGVYRYSRLKEKLKPVKKYLEISQAMGAVAGIAGHVLQAAAMASLLPMLTMADIIGVSSVFAIDLATSRETPAMKQARQDLSKVAMPETDS
jgi:hypothetical protein